MPGTQIKLGPFTKGLHNSAGTGEYIDDAELFDIVNLEVDTDGSLANRPAISSNFPTGLSTRFKVIGTFISKNGTNYLVISYGSGFGTTGLYSITTNSITVSRTVKSNVAVQYNDSIWVVPASDGTAGTGGSWDGSGTPAWTVAATMPRGDDACIYKDRLFITAGLGSTSNSSRLFRSCVGHPEIWFGDAPPSGGANDAGTNDLEPGNGQKLVSCLVMNQDLVCFKEHSTFRYVFSSDPSKVEISKISSTIGTPNIKCAVTYDNNNIYLLHDNSVYELYNYTFTKLSSNIAMLQVPDADIPADSVYGLTLFRNRLFVRYYSNLYVYSLLIGKWSKWSTLKKFSQLFVIPNSTGLDVAWAHSVSLSNSIALWSFVDDRVLRVGIDETFNCSIVTKTYDFDVSWAYKVMFWWGMTIATSAPTTSTAQVPNASGNYTWTGLQAQEGSWGQANTDGIKWDNSSSIIFNSLTPAEQGRYARKFLKFNKKARFRQAFFTISTQASPNNVGDACVRIYDISAFVNQKEIVAQRTT